MAEQLMISVSGMRGIIGENLTASVAADYGCAFGTFLRDIHASEKGKLSVCVGRDSQPSGRNSAQGCIDAILKIRDEVLGQHADG
jgi:phosphomannomutase